VVYKGKKLVFRSAALGGRHGRGVGHLRRMARPVVERALEKETSGMTAPESAPRAPAHPTGTPAAWTALAARALPLVRQYQQAGRCTPGATFRYEVNRELLGEVLNEAKPGLGDNLPEGTVAEGEY